MFQRVIRRMRDPFALKLPASPGTTPPGGSVQDEASDDAATPEAGVAICRDFHSLEQFQEFARTESRYFAPDLHERILAHCLCHGVTNLGLGFSAPSQVTVIGAELREHLMVRGLNARQRAVIDELEVFRATRELDRRDIKIYGHEAITALALHLRGHFPKFIGSEFASTDEQVKNLFPIPHGDVCHSAFPDSSFDAVVSCDVLEHVPEIDLALSETVRILKPRGRFLFTVPFDSAGNTSSRFATLRDGELTHNITTPIYHGNPMDPDGGSLVFEIPAWDLLERGRRAGFGHTAMRFICDQSRGIAATTGGVDPPIKGVFVGVFDK